MAFALRHDLENDAMVNETAPRVLFHGTPLGGLQQLRPGEAGAVYASHDIRLSVAFLADPEHCYCIRKAGQVYAVIAADRSDFVQRDHGGSVYLVDASDFTPIDPRVPFERLWEWTSRRPVRTIGEVRYASALAAMIGHGVRVYFVSLPTFMGCRSAEDTWRIVCRTPCENEVFEKYLARHMSSVSL